MKPRNMPRGATPCSSSPTCGAWSGHRATRSLIGSTRGSPWGVGCSETGNTRRIDSHSSWTAGLDTSGRQIADSTDAATWFWPVTVVLRCGMTTWTSSRRRVKQLHSRQECFRPEVGEEIRRHAGAPAVCQRSCARSTGREVAAVLGTSLVVTGRQSSPDGASRGSQSSCFCISTLRPTTTQPSASLTAIMCWLDSAFQVSICRSCDSLSRSSCSISILSRSPSV